MRGRPAREASSRRCTTCPTARSGRPEEIAKRQREVAHGRRRRPERARLGGGREPAGLGGVKTQTGDWREHVANYKASLREPGRGRHRRRLLQLHAGARLDAHRPGVAARRTAARRCGSTSSTSPPSTSTSSGAGAPRADYPEAVRRRGRPALRRDGRGARGGGSRATSTPACRVGRAHSLDGAARAARALRRHRRRPAAAALRRLPRRGGAGGRAARHAALLPSGRPAVPAARAAADHVDGGRLPRDPRRRRQPGERRRRSAPARSARGPTTTCPAWCERLGPRIHFVHLRNVRKEAGTALLLPRGRAPGGRHRHGRGDRRRCWRGGAAPRRGPGGRGIPMRPDHGQDILDDLKRGAQPAIRRSGG